MAVPHSLLPEEHFRLPHQLLEIVKGHRKPWLEVGAWTEKKKNAQGERYEDDLRSKWWQDKGFELGTAHCFVFVSESHV